MDCPLALLASFKDIKLDSHPELRLILMPLSNNTLSVILFLNEFNRLIPFTLFDMVFLNIVLFEDPQIIIPQFSKLEIILSLIIFPLDVIATP